jgi:hypothetical protein
MHGQDQLMKILEGTNPEILRSLARQSAGSAIIPCRVALIVQPPMGLSENATFAQARLASEVTSHAPGMRKDILIMHIFLGDLYHHPGSSVESWT